MPSSGTVTYSVNELDIITDAFENMGVYGAGEVISADDIAVARRKLNMLVKQWVAQADFAPGLKMWTRRRAWLFLQKNQGVYSLGPSGDHAAEDSYVTTTTTAAASAGASTITVTSIAGLSSGMFIAVKLDSGSLQWTTINGAPSGSTVTLTATLTGAAASGARVFAYTNKPRRPFDIDTAALRDVNTVDAYVDPSLILQDYEALTNKTTDGTPDAFYFEAQRTNAKVYLNREPDDVTKVMRLVYTSYIEDFTQTTDTADFPAEWFRALSAQLALDLCPAYQVPVSAELKLMRDESLRMAQNAYPVTSTASFQPDFDNY